jgi:hypothetical protein
MPNQQLNKQLNDLLNLIGRLDAIQYATKSAMLGGVSVGQHVRHIVELAQCMVQGYASGKINYDGRKRDLLIETDTEFAAKKINELMDSLPLDNKALVLQDGERLSSVTTFYFREVVYNTEHALHHMALIRVALREMGLEIVDENFGVAPSTIRYQQIHNRKSTLHTND